MRGSHSGKDKRELVPDVSAVLRGLSEDDWARFGAEEIAYMRPVVVNGTEAIAIHAGDGTPIGAAPDIGLATAAILQHEMMPARVH
jgi:hypothetical protein